MIHKIAQNEVKREKLGEVENAIWDFVAASADQEMITTYDVYRLEDGVSFLQFMSFPDEVAEKAHQTAQHTHKFVEALYPECEVLPIFHGFEFDCFDGR